METLFEIKKPSVEVSRTRKNFKQLLPLNMEDDDDIDDDDDDLLEDLDLDDDEEIVEEEVEVTDDDDMDDDLDLDLEDDRMMMTISYKWPTAHSDDKKCGTFVPHFLLVGFNSVKAPSKLAVSHAVQKVNNQPNNKPYKEAFPVRGTRPTE
jgi:hypothetical protein